MNTTVTVKGLNWPLELNFLRYSKLLGPYNNLGRFRWYCEFEPGLSESCLLSCFKVDSFLRVIAVGRLRHSCVSPADFESQKARLIAKCIREAKPIT
jgi:hypothetical protein